MSVCVQCEQMMKGKAYGVTVRTALPAVVRSGALMECPGCAIQVVVSFGKAWELAGTWEEHVAVAAKHGNLVIDATAIP